MGRIKEDRLQVEEMVKLETLQKQLAEKCLHRGMESETKLGDKEGDDELFKKLSSEEKIEWNNHKEEMAKMEAQEKEASQRKICLAQQLENIRKRAPIETDSESPNESNQDQADGANEKTKEEQDRQDRERAQKNNKERLGKQLKEARKVKCNKASDKKQSDQNGTSNQDQALNECNAMQLDGPNDEQ